jgi:hypothetical protein
MFTGDRAIQDKLSQKSSAQADQRLLSYEPSKWAKKAFVPAVNLEIGSKMKIFQF